MMARVKRHIFFRTSDDFLVPEEIFEVCDLQVRRQEHHNDRDDSKNHDPVLDLLVLGLQAIFCDSQSVHFSTDHGKGVLDLLSLEFDATKMLFSHDVRVVSGRDTR